MMNKPKIETDLQLEHDVLKTLISKSFYYIVCQYVLFLFSTEHYPLRSFSSCTGCHKWSIQPNYLNHPNTTIYFNELYNKDTQGKIYCFCLNVIFGHVKPKLLEYIPPGVSAKMGVLICDNQPLLCPENMPF